MPGMSGGALTDRFENLANDFVKAGFNFLRFNFRGYEEDESFGDSTLNEELEDLQNVILFLQTLGYNVNHIGLIGKSFGAIKTWLLEDLRVRCYGFIAPASFFGERSTVEELIDRPYKDIEKVDDIVLHESILLHWLMPTIIVHGDKDTVVDLSNSQEIMQKLPNTIEKQLEIVSGAHHSFDNPDDEEQMRKLLVDFFSKNLKPSIDTI
jgi:alpha/beta superfamily hydrolase